MIQSHTSAPTFDNVIRVMPLTPTPPTFSLQLFQVLDSPFFQLNFFCFHFSLLFLIWFFWFRPDGQILARVISSIQSDFSILARWPNFSPASLRFGHYTCVVWSRNFRWKWRLRKWHSKCNRMYSTEPEQEKETVEVDDEGEEDSFLRRRQRK